MAELVESHIQHVKSCKSDSCFRCLYIRNMKHWKKRLPWLADRLWKDPNNENELTWGLGCQLCIKAGLDTSSNFASAGFDGRGGFNSVRRHAKSKAHENALRILSCGNGSADHQGAPSPEQFAQFMVERLSEQLASLFFRFRSAHLPI